MTCRNSLRRQLARYAGISLASLDETVGHVVGLMKCQLSLPVGAVPDLVEPAFLRRPDGASVYSVHGSHRYTSAAILHAERRLLEAAVRTTGTSSPRSSSTSPPGVSPQRACDGRRRGRSYRRSVVPVAVERREDFRSKGGVDTEEGARSTRHHRTSLHALTGRTPSVGTQIYTPQKHCSASRNRCDRVPHNGSAFAQSLSRGPHSGILEGEAANRRRHGAG